MRLKYAITSALVAGMVLLSGISAFACGEAKKTASTAASEEGKAMTTTATFQVAGMHCGSCATKVQNTLSGFSGVSNAVVSFADSRATVEYDPAKVEEEKLVTAVKETGFVLTKSAKTSQLSSQKACDASSAAACSAADKAKLAKGETPACCKDKEAAAKKSKKGAS